MKKDKKKKNDFSNSFHAVGNWISVTAGGNCRDVFVSIIQELEVLKHFVQKFTKEDLL